MKSTILQHLSLTVYHDALTLAYAGRFSDALTDKIIAMSEVYLDSREALSKLRNKTSFLVAECFQNVVRHSTKGTNAEYMLTGKESFIIRMHDCKVFIASENTLPSDEVESLRRKLDEVNRFDADELKARQITSLKEGAISDKGGAGLGLIEMARKTGNKLHYSFMNIDEKTSAFYLMLVLEPGQKDKKLSDFSSELIQIESITDRMLNERHFLFYHGDFNQEIVHQVVEMLENNLDALEGSMANKVRFYNATVQALQNVSLISLFDNVRNTGTLSLGRTDKHYAINTLCPESKDTQKELILLLEHLRREEISVAEKVIRQNVEKGIFRFTAEAVDGFIDIARVASDWNYEFESFEDLPLQFIFRAYV